MNLNKFLRISLFVLLLPLLLSLETGAKPALAQVGNPSFSKSFSPDTIGPGSVSTLTFFLFNEDQITPAQNLAFTDVLPAGVVIATPANASSGCGGTLTAPDGGSTITFTDGLLGANSGCTINVDVTSSTPGLHTNISGAITSNFGTGSTASADLTVATDRPSFSKSFSPSTLPLGGRSTLTFTIDNALNASPVGSLDFTDNLPTGLLIADPANASTDCISAAVPNTTLTAVPGSSDIILDANGDTILPGREVLPSGAACTVTVDVVATGVGMLDNVTGDLTYNNTESSGKASATVTVTATPIALIKTFTDDPIPPGGTATLQFTITNLNRLLPATDIAFSDDLTTALAGLTFDSLQSNTCGGIVAGVGTTTVNFSGGSLAPEASCSIVVSVTVPVAAMSGGYANTTGAVTGTVDGAMLTGNVASDILFVDPVPTFTKEFVDDPVNGGESVTLRFTITNTDPASGLTGFDFTDDLNTAIPGLVANSLVAANGLEPDPLLDPCGTGSVLTIPDPNDTLPSPPFPNFPPDPTMLNFTGGSLAPAGSPGDSCSFDVVLDVPIGTPAGTYLNTTTDLLTGTTSLAPPATDNLVIIAAPRLVKTFTDDPVAPGGTVTLEFTLNHSDDASSGITFTDDLATVLTGLTANLPVSPAPPCGPGSTLTGSAGNTLLTLSNGALNPGGSCTFSVTLNVPAAAAPAVYTNTTSAVSATMSGQAVTSAPASDRLAVAGLTFSKAFADDPVIPGEMVNLRFTIENTHPTDDATGLAFDDDLSLVLPGAPDLTVIPPLPAQPCGPSSSIVGTTSLSFSGGELLSATSCTFTVTLQVPAGIDDGTYRNTTGSLTAIQGGAVTIDPATDELVVNSELLQLTKTFTDDPTLPGDTVTLEFTLTNLDATQAASNIAFTDSLGGALSGLVATGLPFAACGGTLQGIPDNSTLDFSGGSLAAGASCTFSLILQVPASTPPGTRATNTTSEATGTINGLTVRGGPASDVLQVDVVIFSKAFDGPSVAGGLPQLTFTIENVDATSGVSDLSFIDDIDAALPGLAAVGLPAGDVCGAGSQLSGTSLLTFSGGQLGPGGVCMFTVPLQVPGSASAGNYLNVTSSLDQNGISTANPATATLTIEPPPVFSKSFSPDPIMAGQTSTLNFTIDNTASAVSASSLSFTDNLPAGLVVATPPNASFTCTGGTLTAAAGAGIITYSGGTVAAGTSCTIQVDVTSSIEGVYVNVSGDLTSSSGTSGPASDNLTVTAAPDLTITKSVTPLAAMPGQAITYTLTFSNAGGVPAGNVVITDMVPAGVLNTLVVSSGAAITQTAPGYGWAVQDLAPGQGGVITISGLLTTSLSAGILTNTATIAGPNDFALTNNSSSAALTVGSLPPPPVYLPQVLNNFNSGTDLVIETLLASSNQVSVTVRNVGNVSVVDAFWVQIAINPFSPISDVNQRWDTLGNSGGGPAQGALWGVVSPAVPLPVGATLTLTLNGPYYFSGDPANNVPSPIPAGATIYAQVDAINFATTYGNVLEIDETNNISTTTATAAFSVVEPATVDVTGSNLPGPSLPGLTDETKE